jgi:ABC-type transport system involved in multi-copper enzyme maturation permease subunit
MVLAAAGLGVVFLGLFALGTWQIDREIQREGTNMVFVRQIYSFLLLAGLYVVHFLTIMLTIFASVDTIAGEISSNTIQAIVTKPVRRWQVLLGKWLGYAAMISAYLALLGGGVMLAMYMVTGYLPPNPAQGLGLLMLEALVLLSVSLLGGTRLSTLTNGVVLFMLYGLAFVGAWVEQIGALLQSRNAIRIGVIASLLMPVEALWRRASYLMQPPFSQGVPSPFTSSSVPSGAMIIYATIYATAALGLAIFSFARRDL